MCAKAASGAADGPAMSSATVPGAQEGQRPSPRPPAAARPLEKADMTIMTGAC